MGIPTIGGDIYFDASYEGNPLVNAMALGIIKKDEIVRGAAHGVGNPVYYVGATTGRDGLGGAAFASKELSEQSHEDRPAVQVGDPFMEKLLMEACLELLRTDALVGMQDMGAAGLTCAGCETASRASTGVEIDLVKVPRREPGMTPYETLLSESQERMLVIVKKGKEKEVEAIFEKWDLHAVKIGEVTRGDKYRVLDNGKMAAEIPAKALADDGPVYTREEEKPAYLAGAQKLVLAVVPEPKDFDAVLKRLLTHPSIASKVWVWQQYDHMVRTDTVFYPGHDASLIRVKGTQKGIAVSTDCNSLYAYLDPFEGGKIAVAEAARNVVCSGARPVGMTNCLNFGNPMKPEVFWQFHNAVSGMIESCKTLEIPVTGGNVSFYNESPQGAIYPTPTIGVVGLLENIEKRVPSSFQNEGDVIFLAGDTLNEIGGSHYLMIEHGLKQGLPPRLDLKREKELHQFILAAADGKKLASCHDLSEGGLGVALAECCLKSAVGLGAVVNSLNHVRKGHPGLRDDALYFGETQSRVLISVRPEHQKDLKNLAQKHGVVLHELGKVGGQSLILEEKIRLAVQDMAHLFENTITNIMERK
jgi:phosphoribosylformylglycinamidine synthase